MPLCPMGLGVQDDAAQDACGPCAVVCRERRGESEVLGCCFALTTEMGFHREVSHCCF